MFRRYAGLVTCLIVGFSVRLLNIDQWPLWGDEALTPIIAQWSLKALFLYPVDPTPGLYYSLHKALLGPLVGAGEARLISLAAGTLLIPASYVLAKESQLPAGLAAALVALSFPLIDYSQEARAYSLLVLFVVLSAACFVRWARTGQLHMLLTSLMFGLLAFYTHFSAVFWVGPLLAGTAWIGRRRAVAPLLATITLAIPELSRLAHYHQPGFTWLLQASPIQAVNTLGRAILPFRLSGGLAAAFLVIIVGRIWTHRSRLVGWATANRAAAAALLALLAVPLAVWLFGFFLKPIFMTRTILVALPGYALALALLLRFERRWIQLAVVAAYAAGLLYTGTTRPKEDWGAIAARVKGDTVLMCQSWQGPAMKHALEDDTPVILRYGDGLMRIDGEPWQIAYHDAFTRDDGRRRALRQGQTLSADHYPVWPVRTGLLKTLGRKPFTLAEAIRICDENRADTAPRYQAE